jgi:hypothetical protein
MVVILLLPIGTKKRFSIILPKKAKRFSPILKFGQAFALNKLTEIFHYGVKKRAVAKSATQNIASTNQATESFSIE